MISTLAQNQIYTLVAKVSGHNEKDLEPDLFLESDLGLDSIKIVELLNNLMQMVPENRQAEFLQVMPIEQLMQLQTLAELITIADAWLVSSTNNKEKHQKLIKTLSKDDAISEVIPEENAEIIDAQYIFLATHSAVTSCSVCSTVRFSGTFEIETAQQSWRQLLLRHPMLRAYFSIPSNAQTFQDYQLLILNNPQPPKISIIDLQTEDLTTQEAYIENKVNEAINETWSLEEWPLHRFFVFHLEDSIYELGLVHHHILSDGLSNQIILREFLEIYGAILNGQQPNLSPPTSVDQYRQQCQKINQWQDPQGDLALQAYLNRQGKNNFFWTPEENKKATIPNQPGKFCSHTYSLEANITEIVKEQARNWRLSLNSLVIGAYLKAINTIAPQNGPMILNVPTSGRIYPDVDVSQMVGCFAQNFALSFPIAERHQDDLSFLEVVHSEIQSALASGYDNAQTRQMGELLCEKITLQDGKLPPIAGNLLKSAIKSNLYLSNMGNTHIQNQYYSLQILDYRSATGTIPGGIDTLVDIFNDELHFSTNYDSNVWPASLIKALSRQFLAELKRFASLEINLDSLELTQLSVGKNSKVSSLLQKVIHETCHLSIDSQTIGQDLEADLGIDSLELIRIVTKLEKQLGQKLNRQALLACRSLGEMAEVLNSALTEISTLEHSSAEENDAITMPYVAIIEQVKRTPDAVAILDGNTQLSYQQLHRLSNQVAHYLRKHGVKPGDLIGIMTERTPLLWVGILGILKAGAAYVPIDPAYPEKRICYMLNHAEIGMLLTESQLSDKLESCIKPDLPLRGLVFLDEGANLASKKPLKQANRGIWSQESQEDLPIVNNPDDLMVVLYTSGSTGRPKGVMLNHQGYMNRLQWMQKTFQLVPGDRVVQKTSCCFDISIWEIFWPLMVGATVCPIQKELVRDPWTLAQWLNDNHINIMHFVPSLFGEFLNALEDEDSVFPHLKWLIFSGEALPIPFIQTWLDRYGTDTGLANLYGPTEASIDVSCHLIQQRPGEQGETSIPIGKAIDNVDLLVLDANLQPIAPGELGELWIGGIQLAKGYLKDPERTAKAFCPNPFPDILGEHLYRTGDLAKQLPDGSFEYHGRIDHQVKIRGFRIELGEIESALLSHEAINEAAVVVLETGDSQKRLVAGVAGSQVDARQMKEYLGQKLPYYMIPHRLEWLPNLPKNHNGKLDRKALLRIISGQDVPSSIPISQPPQTVLPLGPAQRWLIRYFDAPHQWTGYTRCLYHQPLDLDIFNQAINHLVERHWSLRTIFVQREGQWWQEEIQPQYPFQAMVYDGTHLSSQERNVLVHQQIQELAQGLRINCWPLIQVLVIQINETCYDINLIGHHMISDLLSSQLLFREFWLIYSQLLSNDSDKLQNLSNSLSYADYVSYLMEKDQQEALESHLDYWKSQFPSPKSRFQIPFDQQLGTNLEVSAASECFILSQEDTSFLLSQAKQYYGCNVYHLLLAPLYRLMAEWSGSNDVILSHRSHGRYLGNNQQFFNSFGNFAVNFPLGVTVDKTETWKPFVSQIKNQFEQLPMNGITFDWIGEQLPSYLYPDHYLTPVRVNYLGNRDIRPSQIFEFIKEDLDRRLSLPEQKRTTLLECFFSITNGCLELQIEYSQNFHVAATIKELGNNYLGILQDLLKEVPCVKSVGTNKKCVQLISSTQKAKHSELPLIDKVAIITGITQEIGQAITLKLARQGANVVAISPNSQILEDMVSQIQQFGGQALAITGDMSQLEQVQTTFKQIIKQYGTIDILVNQAHVTELSTLASSEPTKWRKTLEANLFGTYYCCHSAIPYLLLQNQGKIINLGSDSSFVGYSPFSAYAASNYGIAGLTKSLSKELKQHNIQVNAVCPAFVNTVHPAKVFEDDTTVTTKIAEAVSFLASSVADNITGECLNIFSQF